MSVQTRINRGRRLAGVSEGYYENDEALEDFNIRYKRITQLLLNRADNKHFWDYGKADIISGQYEYKVDQLLPVDIADPTLIIDKIDRVLIKSGDNYKVLDRIAPNELSDSQMASNGTVGFSIRDKSVFIYPTPTEAVTEGLKFEVESNPADLELVSVLDDIKIPSQYHYIIDFGIAADALIMERKYNESQFFESNFEKGLSDIARGIKRTKTPVEVK